MADESVVVSDQLLKGHRLRDYCATTEHRLCLSLPCPTVTLRPACFKSSLIPMIRGCAVRILFQPGQRFFSLRPRDSVARRTRQAKVGKARLACAETRQGPAAAVGSAILKPSCSSSITASRSSARLFCGLRSTSRHHPWAVPRRLGRALMQLREPEAFGVFDHHDRSVGNIDADFDHCGRDQNAELAVAENRMIASRSSTARRPWTSPTPNP